MVDYTDRHFRWFLRLLTPRSLLYTEMITAPAILRGDREHLLGFTPVEKPLVLQVAGDRPDELARAIEAAEAYDYDEINLNCGCPSDKVQEAHYGACLMAEPALVGRLVKAMRAATSKPVTVKHRIGLKNLDSYDQLRHFAETCVDAGAQRLIVHARIAILEGLSPKENRTVPPLRYEDVYRLKADLPQVPLEINGGIKTFEAVQEALNRGLDGVMVGRLAYEDPARLAAWEARLGGQPGLPSRRAVLQALDAYVSAWEERGVHWHRILLHIHDLFAYLKGGRRFRQLLAPPFSRFARGHDLIEACLQELPAETLDAPWDLAAPKHLD